MNTIEREYRQRISFNGDLNELSKIICKDFNLGSFVNCKIVFIGYEDFNLFLKSVKGEFLVKIFSEARTIDNCKRIVEVIEEALKKKINTPKMFQSKQGYLHIINIKENKLRLGVMEFISEKDLFTSKLNLNKEEISQLAVQVALINQLPLKPAFIYDSWAITNFSKEFKDKSSVLEKADLLLIKPLVKKFEELNIQNLPHCFVHGDIIRTNLIKNNNNKLWIIDFSCANYYPRIQELAVLACDILFDRKSKENSNRNFNLFLKEYQKSNLLTIEEIKILPLYIKMAHAMHVLRANYEKKVNHNLSAENEYYLELGRAGLKQK